MKPRFSLPYYFCFLFLPLARSAEAESLVATDLCNIHIEGPESIDFTSTEQKWLCGDPESNAWKEIPVPQQRAWLRSFLQNRGYHKHEFFEAGGKLIVKTGERSVVERFTVEGAPAEWNWAKRRNVIGSILDPTRMDDNTNWAKRALQFRGYPCPKVEGQAFLDTNELLLKVQPGPKQKFGSVTSQGASDMDSRILERFTAFEPDEDFDLRLLELTSDRILREDLYLSTFYDVICDDNQEAKIVRRFVAAAPRLLTFGLGFDTERGPIGRARWKRTRLTRKADSLEAMAFLSFREQQLEVKYRNHFPSDPGSRLEFAPTFTVDRRDEAAFESISYQIQPALAHSFEHQTSQTVARLGPMLKRTEIRRPGLSRVDNLRLSGELGLMSKMFEYYSNDPREGWRFYLEAWTQVAGVMAGKTIHKLLLGQEMLWNLGNYDPPFFVLGWRGYQGTYFFDAHQNLSSKDVPENERFYLGGDDDIRGFGRKKLVGNGHGYLTVLYQGFELRVVDWLPYKLQPFVFFDLAKAGIETQTFSAPLYYAPGLGMRWSSPVGTLRASLARGFATSERIGDPVPNLQFFLSFGKEF